MAGGDGDAVIQNRIKALGQCLNEVIDAAGFTGPRQLLLRDAGLVVDQVLPDGALKKPGVLEHHAEQIVDVLSRHLGGGDAVDLDATAVDLKKSHQQIHHSGLARPGGPHDGHLLSGQDVGGEILDDDLVRVVGVAEPHMVEFHLAPDVLEFSLLSSLVGQLLGMEKVEDVVAGGRRCLHLGHTLGQRAQRGGKETHIEDKGHDDTKGDLPGHRQAGAQNAHRHIAQVAHNVHHGLHDAGQELAAPLRVVEDGVHAAEGLLDLVVRPGQTHHVMPGIHLLDVAVEGAQVHLPGGEVLLRAEHHSGHEHKAQHRHGNGGQGHAPLGNEHHNEAAHELGRGADDGGQAVGQGLLQGTHIVGHPAEDVAMGHGVEVAHRHPVDLPGQILPQIPGQVQGDGGHDVVLHIGEDKAETIDRQQDDPHPANGAKVDLPAQGGLDEVGDLAEEAGADDGEDGADGGKAQGHGHGGLQFAGIGEQLPQDPQDAPFALGCRSHPA